MTALQIEALHMYSLENGVQHHTNLYEVVHKDPSTPVLRRGQPFYIVIKFRNRGYNDNFDLVKLIFNYGTRPVTQFGVSQTMIGVATLDSNNIFDDDIQSWDVRISGYDADSITLEVRSPVTAPVGIWRLTIETSLTAVNGLGKQAYEYPEFIYLLFNPWLKEDTVYMPEQQLLDEYVLNDVGKIWVGPITTSRGREWVFGQFDAIVLPSVMLILERTELPPIAKGDPVRLTRALSKMINSNDDLGVIYGRWDGDYADGTAPSAWTGSVPILEKYLDTRKEVLYGQCWVFAGVLTTVCRALGIPSRVVSNLVSAHDANESLTIDRYYSTKNEELPFDPHNPFGEDSIWNYHVWNDVWMARPDLPKGYGGWQAIDATPQETSEGVYQCGPASVEAIRHGEVGFRYDTGFLLASVNADLVRWKEDLNSPIGYTRIECNKYHIGRMIITKQPYIFDPNGDGDKQDITDEYKPMEGTNAERLSLYNGIRGTTRAKRFYDLPDAVQSDVSFELVEIDRINVGSNFSVIVNLKNSSNQERNIEAALSTSSVFYNGVKAHPIKKANGVFKMQPNSNEQLKLNIKSQDYVDKLVEHNMLKIYVIATVHETKQTWAGEDDFQVIVPNLNITIPSIIELGLSTTAIFHFKNPLNKTLTKCKLTYEGPGLTKSTTIDYRDIEPYGELRVEARFTPFRSGDQKLIAVFVSKELADITGSVNVPVSE